MNSEDRLSQFPDEILHLILSFLTSLKEAAKTSRLSRRWRNLWLSTPYFFFDDVDGVVRRRGGKPSSDFRNFVNRVLLSRAAASSDEHTFRLHWRGRGGFDADLFSSWVQYALKHNVRVLDDIVASECLEVLALTEPKSNVVSPTIIPELDPSRLRWPKRLRVDGYVFMPETLENLISGSIVLEGLKLENCALPGSGRFVGNADAGNLQILLGSQLEITFNDVNDPTDHSRAYEMRSLYHAYRGGF